MRYCEYPPTAQLARSVACIWTLEGDAGERDEAPQPILPDGRAEFVMLIEARCSGSRGRFSPASSIDP
jgi:hypothetical protein